MTAPARLVGLAEALEAAQLPYDEVVLVLGGAARRGRPEGHGQGLRVEHADANGDDAIVDEVARQVPNGAKVEVVTADRELRSRVAVAGGTSLGPSWLLNQL